MLKERRIPARIPANPLSPVDFYVGTCRSSKDISTLPQILYVTVMATLRIRRIVRGLLKYLVLKALAERPMHGYEIIKYVSGIHEGMYQPSPGIIYPLLRRLEKWGYIVSERVENKVIYSITDRGRKYLETHHEKFEPLLEERKRIFEENSPIVREFMKVRNLLIEGRSKINLENREKIAGLLREAREKISRILEKS